MLPRFITFAAVAAVLLPLPLFAQECVTETQPGCPSGLEGKCPLGLLFEDFITTPTGYVVPPVSERPFNPDAGDKILIKRFIVEGVVPNPEMGVTVASVQAVADAAWDRIRTEQGEVRLTVGQMVRVGDEVTTYFRNKGYLVARAFIPVQAIGADSVVKIQVLEGRVSEVEVTGASGYSPEVLSRPAASLLGATPTRDSVETALLYAQDYPGVRLFGTFRPGAESGDTKLVLQVLGEESFEYSIGGDNYGLESTGIYRLRADATWNNPVGWGDEMGVTVLQAVAPENTTLGELHYRVPVGVRGLGLYFDGSHNEFRVSGEDFQLTRDILEGTLTSYKLGSDWRFMRSRFFNSFVSLDYARKQAEQILLGQLTIVDEQLNVLALKAGLDRVDTRFRGLDQGSIGIRKGVGGQSTGIGQQTTDFTVFDLKYARVQPVTDTQTVVLRLRAQDTSTRISSIERFALTGPDAVRAYPVGDGLTDTGMFASLEYRVGAPGFAKAAGPFDRPWGDLLQFWLFGDYANGKNAGGFTPREFAGYGLSIQFAVPGTFQVLIQGAKALTADSEPATDGDDFRVYGEFSVKF